MLIGIDASRAVAGQRTGTETYSLNLIRALVGLGTGHRFWLYTNRKRSPPLQEIASAQTTSLAMTAQGPNIEIRAIPCPRLWTHIRLSAEMLTRPPDVLFVPAHVLPLIHPRRSVVTVHDLGYLWYPQAHRPADRRYLDWSTRWNAQQAAAVLADSQATKADLARAYGINPAKIHVIYLGRDAALGPVRDADLLAAVRERYGITGRYLLYVGTLQPRKNLARVIEAFGRLAGDPSAGSGQAPTLADIQLVLAGKRGWLYDDLFAQATRAGLAERVIFPGYITDTDLPALLSGATAFVFPSLYEGFGIPVLEAGACGVPVITSNTSSLPEVAGDPSAGSGQAAALLVDPHDVDAIADAMYRLITDAGLRAELTRRGQENIKRFSWEKCARETLAVLEAVGGAGDTVTR